jgi:hypothetical protein
VFWSAGSVAVLIDFSALLEITGGQLKGCRGRRGQFEGGFGMGRRAGQMVSLGCGFSYENS